MIEGRLIAAGYLGIDRYLLPLLGTPWYQPKLVAPAPQVTVSRTA